MADEKKVRTRFAPSPTGFLHVGGVRTALFAWLVARQAGGQFILRLEDTDKAREVEGSGEHIIKSLKWLGIDWDEGFDIGGKFGPYKQSERLDTYRQRAQKLVDSGRAYADPYSPEQVEAFRQECQSAKKPFLFRNYRPEKPPVWDGSRPLRFKSDPKARSWHDAVMGEMSAGPEADDDFILIKSDGYPTYNLAHIVDDADMEISHVIRTQEFLSSIPRFLDLYEALGIEHPILTTLPYVMAIDGKKKLGKRDGAKDILDYDRQGILPEAMMNFLVTLGWNDGTEQEIFSVGELKEKFSLERVQKSGARFDEKRLLWMNGHYIRQLPPDELFDRAKAFWLGQADEAYQRKVLNLVQERMKYLGELPELTGFFFEEPNPQQVRDLYSEPPDKQLRNMPLKTFGDILLSSIEALKDSDFSKEDIAERLNKLLLELDTKPGVLFAVIRIAVSGEPSTPELFGTLEVLGKPKSLDRLRRAVESLEK